MISAVVLAAGQSKRMGQPKVLLPWGECTVIEKIITTLRESGIYDIHLVVGGLQKELEDVLSEYNLKYIDNKDYLLTEMLTSLQLGLKNLTSETEAALVVLGDQPQISSRIIKIIINEFYSSRSRIIIPSYEMKRGHPVLLARHLWKNLLTLNPSLTLKDFLNDHIQLIKYVVVDSPSILQDIDTPDDYYEYKP